MAELIAIIATAVTAIARVVEKWLDDATSGCREPKKKRPEKDHQPRCCPLRARERWKTK